MVTGFTIVFFQENKVILSRCASRQNPQVTISSEVILCLYLATAQIRYGFGFSIIFFNKYYISRAYTCDF